MNIHIGDCIEYMSRQPDDSFGAVVTSPPYNIGVNYGPGVKDNMTNEEYDEFTIQWVSQALRVAPVLVVNFGCPTSRPDNLGRFISSVTKVGVIQSHIIWIKAFSTDEESRGHFKPVNSKRYLTNLHESVFIVSRDGNYPLDRLAVGVPFKDKSNISRFKGNGGEDRRCRGNVWFIPYETRTSKLDHPATYPVALAELMIKIVGSPSTILDPFVGSGTTLLACDLLNIKGVGVDLVDYVKPVSPPPPPPVRS